MSKTQKGVLLHKGAVTCTEIVVPQPPPDHTKIDPASYSSLLPGSDPQHLLLAAVPFSGLLGLPLLLVYDANSQEELNPCATRLTTNLDDGLEIKVHGDALAFHTQPGLDFTPARWAELDNVIYSELVSAYERGHKPNEEELKQIVEDFKAGRFNYARREGEEDEDANKDDGGDDLRAALESGGAFLVPEAVTAAGMTLGNMPRPPSGLDWRPLVAEGHPGAVRP